MDKEKTVSEALDEEGKSLTEKAVCSRVCFYQSTGQASPAERPAVFLVSRAGWRCPWTCWFRVMSRPPRRKLLRAAKVMSLVRWRRKHWAEKLMKEPSWQWKVKPVWVLFHPGEFCTFSCWLQLCVSRITFLVTWSLTLVTPVEHFTWVEWKVLQDRGCFAFQINARVM